MTNRTTNVLVVTGAVLVVGCLGVGLLAIPFVQGFKRGYEEAQARAQAAEAGAAAPIEVSRHATPHEVLDLAVEDLIASDEWSDQDLRARLEHYLFEPAEPENINQFLFEFFVLDALDERVDPMVAAILTDPAARERLSAPLPVADAGETIHHTPMDRAVALLQPPVPREVVPGLAPMLSYDDPTVRAAGARALGRIVSSSVVAPLNRALDDGDPNVRAAALEGLEWPDAWGHLMGPGSAELFDRLAELAAGDDPPAIAPTVMLGMNPERAEPLLLADDLAALIGDERLGHRLAAFDWHQRPIERERLLAVISALRMLPPEEPHCTALGHALGILALEGNPRDEPMLRVLASSNHGCQEERAAQALLTLRGLGNLEEVLVNRTFEVGLRGMTTPEANTVLALDLELCGRETSLLDTFEVVVGDDWQLALDGLKAMGAKQHALVYEAAIAKFGPEGPSLDQEQRTRQVAELREAKAFDKLDAAWKALEAPLRPLIVDYVLANESAFVGLRADTSTEEPADDSSSTP